MGAGIYKKGQGYWTRLMSAIAFGLIVLMGTVWLWDLLATTKIGDIQTIYVQAGGAVLVLGFFGILGFYLIGRKPAVVDFMIATEGEMKKVNWSSRREVLGSTWIVIALTIFIAILCFAYDRVFQIFFQWMGVLESA
ncbi:MAG: preprotein translocase subunit SecE [Planctomycetota bacterium]|nr:preprotein translocase subunit SecE [Planctomycetota bacterium]